MYTFSYGTILKIKMKGRRKSRRIYSNPRIGTVNRREDKSLHPSLPSLPSLDNGVTSSEECHVDLTIIGGHGGHGGHGG